VGAEAAGGISPLGVALTLGAAAGFGLAVVFSRRGVLHGTVYGGIVMNVWSGLPLFLLAAIVFSQLTTLGSLGGWTLLALLATGVLNYGVGRFANYQSIRSLGANRSAPLRAIAPTLAMGLGVAFLGERLTVPQWVGAGLLLAAPLVMVVGQQQAAARASAANRAELTRGLVWGLGAGVAYGLSLFLIRLMLAGTGMAVGGALMVNVGAAAFLAGFLALPGPRAGVRGMSGVGMRWYLVGGLIIAAAHIMRFSALELTPVSIVSPLFETNVLFGVLFSWLINRRHEHFTGPVLIAIGLSLAGTLSLVL
jgi:drug/metabolite transporter (DMT)-like permease